MTITKNPQVILASVGRENFFKSKNHPHQMFAEVAASPDVKEARVRERTEKLHIESVYLSSLRRDSESDVDLLVSEIDAHVYTIPLKSNQDRNQQVDLFSLQQSPHLAELQEGGAVLVLVRDSLAIGADDFVWR